MISYHNCATPVKHIKPLFILLILSTAFVCSSKSACAEDNVAVYGEYLTDSEGWNYGANYYLDNNCNYRVAVFPYIDQSDNIIGDITTGPVIMGANETRVSIGSVKAAADKQAWSSHVSAKWQPCGPNSRYCD